MNSLQIHKQEMERLKEEIKIATGYRKKDLLKKLRIMNKEMAEYQMWQKKSKAVSNGKGAV